MKKCWNLLLSLNHRQGGENIQSAVFTLLEIISLRHFSEGKEDLVLSNGGAGASELPSDSEDEETDV